MDVHDQLETVFFLYCCVIGIIGNAFTCFLLKRRISRFKFYMESQKELLNKTSKLMHIDKSILFDYRHNWNLYMYFIGINIFDSLILVNWIVSRLSIKLGNAVKAYKRPCDTCDNGWSDYMVNTSVLDKNDYERFLSSNGLESVADFNISRSFSGILEEIGRQIIYADSKLIDLQGVCQIYYYFTIVALQASFAYTFACLLDRMFKLKIINK